MKVQLKILDKNRGVMRVHVYEVGDRDMTFFCEKEGTISDIKFQLEKETGDDIEIEKSIFQGWY